MSRYDKDKVIGTGTFGNVWLVKSKLSRHSFVLKEINLSSLHELDRQKSLNEASILSKFKHKHIIRYKDAWIEDQNTLSIVMEYAEGGDLYAAITKQDGVPFTEHRIISWFIQICLALQYIHYQNILHRDLKSQNIFLTRNKSIKVGDFGIARVLRDPKELVETAIGTPYYLSPEICQRQPYNYKSDIWSLGCVLFELAALEFAFKAYDFIHLISLIINGQRRELPRHCSTLIQNLVEDLLNIDSEQRPSTDEILSNSALQPYLSEYMITQNSRQMKFPVLMGLKEADARYSPRNQLKNSLEKRRSSISGINQRGNRQTNGTPKPADKYKNEYTNPRIHSSKFYSPQPVKSSGTRPQEFDTTYMVQNPKVNRSQRDMSAFTTSLDTFLSAETGIDNSHEGKLTKSENSMLCEMDNGYHSQESDKSSQSNSMSSNTYKRRSFSVGNIEDGVNPANDVSEEIDAFNGDSGHIDTCLRRRSNTPDSPAHNHCKHSQCHQCMLDMLWKNRIQPCPGKTVNTDEYNRLRKKLLLVYKESFYNVYQSLIYDWEGKEKARCKFENIMNALNFEQAQSLPLMMQLIQLNMLMNVEE